MAMQSGVRFTALMGGALIAFAATGVGYAPAAHAQVGPSQRSFSIPAGPLSQVAVRFSEQAGVQLVLGSDVSEGLQASAVEGRYTVGQALDRMLAGTGLSWRYASAGVIAIERAGGTAAAEGLDTGAKVFGTVRVEGAQNLDAAGFGRLDSFGPGAGANGSSDPAATEGTGSYTTNGSVIASRTPQPLQETTQSVTVMTQQRMEEQNLTDLNQLMDFTPGISVQTVSSVDQQYISRGYNITSYSIDGGAPLSFSTGVEGSLDLAEYDRIEVLRGSAAQFGSIGEPGGIISLVRKRPLDHEQFLMEFQGGSFDYFRVSVDATKPIAFDGRLRGRVIASVLNRDFFFDFAHEVRPKIFGSLELDLWKGALIRGGASYQNQKIDSPNLAGVPRFANGDELPLPRSTNYSAPFSFYDLDNIEYFGTFEQQFGPKWLLKLDATSTKNRSKGVFQVLNGPRADTGGITPGQTTVGILEGFNSKSEFDFANLGLSANLSGSFMLFGNEQQLTLGAQRTRTSSDGTTDSFIFGSRAGQRFAVNVFNFDPSSVPALPATPLVVSSFRIGSTVQSFYGSLNLEPVRGLHVNGGLRQTSVKARGSFESTIFRFNPPLVQAGTNLPRDESDLSPSASASYDFTPWLAAYASFNDIFNPQDDKLSGPTRFDPSDPTNEANTATALPLPPARGETYEGGIRFKLRGGKLNGHLAYYRTQVRDLAQGDNTNPARNFIPRCCFTALANSRSRGLDVELNGEIFEGFQLAASYNYNKNTSSFEDRTGLNGALNLLFPRHIVKLHGSYDFLRGPLSGLTVAAGLRLESKRAIIAFRCTTFSATNACTAQEFFSFNQPGYKVVDGLINYRATENIELSLNLYNIFDERYFANPGDVTGKNFYGQPRSFVATTRFVLGDRYKKQP